MSKRKAGVSNIIYELDNDDIEISSEDETKERKINRLETKENEIIVLDECKPEKPVAEEVSVNHTEEEGCQNNSPTNSVNGGKTPLSPESSTNNSEIVNSISPKAHETVSVVDSSKKLDMDVSKTTIYNEDIIIDSPASNSDLGVVGCENRTPLVTVRFRDRQLASTYKSKLKSFMLRLIKLHEKESSQSFDSETDIELDIWPEDLNEEENSGEEPEANNQDNLFFIDTDPGSNRPFDVPTYKNVSTLICNTAKKEESPPPPVRRGPCCFNCEGAHQLRECVLPKNHARIAENRKQIIGIRVGRYHVEDEQKYGHLIPGRISGHLRHALGLKRNQLPLHIYRMRMLGYPPGWLEEARISHSGITMFDSSGSAILDPEEEEGQVCEPGSKDKFDIKKILDFPGFNVPFSSRYKEEGQLYGQPPMSEQDSKIAMLQMLAPNAMKAYKRKKLTLFPSASNNLSAPEVAEMDLDSGDEVAEFPSVPPLPDEAPPPPPPPPAEPEPEPELEPELKPEPEPPGGTDHAASETAQPAAPEAEAKVESDDDKSVKVVEVIKVMDIPVPETLSITIDDDDDFVEEINTSSGRGSPSLDDLEMKKKILLDALQGDDGEESLINISTDPEIENVDDNSLKEKLTDEAMDVANMNKEVKDIPMNIETTTEEILNTNMSSPTKEPEEKYVTVQTVSTPESKTGKVKTTQYGTPVMNVASPYMKLPSDDKFAKDISDVINFENLPNSTGKYKKICNILKRVKTEVDRIQDS